MVSLRSKGHSICCSTDFSLSGGMGHMGSIPYGLKDIRCGVNQLFTNQNPLLFPMGKSDKKIVFL